MAELDSLGKPTRDSTSTFDRAERLSLVYGVPLANATEVSVLQIQIQLAVMGHIQFLGGGTWCIRRVLKAIVAML